uniref:Uncharacterized protein n=1 Tax=Salix viminalis TaxID=40686 RepID=A0A6N2MUY4_SALVM
MVKFNSSSGRPRFPFLPQPFALQRCSPPSKYLRSLSQGKRAQTLTRLVVFSKRVSPLEEAIERELQKTTKFRKRPPLRRGRVSPRLSVAGDIPKPPYLGSNELPEIASEHQIHESEGIVKMRAAYELGAHVLENAAGSTGGVTWPNNQTTLTADGSPAAQFGHTISIIRTGVGILTHGNTNSSTFPPSILLS